MIKIHSFHIPVMGIGFTVDTPLKVSQYGIDSVISLIDDILLEKLRKMYCEKFEIPYNEITEKIEDFRAKRITSYLNLMNNLAKKKFEELKSATIEKSDEIKEYFNMLPDSLAIKQEFKNLTAKYLNLNEIGNWIKDNLSMGSIDVNIMTKLDKENYVDDEKLPAEYNDAHAALRGYANSDLNSSIVFSAGMNPRLYSYIEQFEDFYPDKNGKIKAEDLKTIKYLKRYLDATKSTLFFARKIILVEGISEQILIPKLFEKHTDKTLEKIGCNIVNVNGVAFKHFLEIIKKGYFIKCLVLTDRDTDTKTEGRADDLKTTYEADNNVIKVEISNESTYEKNIISTNKEELGKEILFDALIKTRPENGPKLQAGTGEDSINVDSFFNEIETRNDAGRKTADFKADFSTNLLEVLNKKKENCQNFTIPEYIKNGFDFIYPQITVTDAE